MNDIHTNDALAIAFSLKRPPAEVAAIVAQLAEPFEEGDVKWKPQTMIQNHLSSHGPLLNRSAKSARSSRTRCNRPPRTVRCRWNSHRKSPLRAVDLWSF